MIETTQSRHDASACLADICREAASAPPELADIIAMVHRPVILLMAGRQAWQVGQRRKLTCSTPSFPTANTQNPSYNTQKSRTRTYQSGRGQCHGIGFNRRSTPCALPGRRAESHHRADPAPADPCLAHDRADRVARRSNHAAKVRNPCANQQARHPDLGGAGACGPSFATTSRKGANASHPPIGG